MRRRRTVLCRWLLAFYTLAQGVPVVQASLAYAAAANTVMVELCSGDGVRRIALNSSGQPLEWPPAGQHAGHDCTACGTGCAHHPLGAPQGLAFILAWPAEGPPCSHGPSLAAGGPAARAPLPARGPSTLS